MTNEEFLIGTLKNIIADWEQQILFIKNLPDDYSIAGFDDGKICGYARALADLKLAVSQYEKEARQDDCGKFQ